MKFNSIINIKGLLAGVTLLLFAQAANSQTTIKGTVNDDLGPAPFANVFIAGTTLGATTDFDGNFTITVKPGTYDVVASFIGYTNDTVKGVTVVSGGTQQIEFLLQQGITLVDFVVEAEINRESTEALVEERKETVTMVESIGAEAMSDKGVGDAAEASGKMVGLSVVGSKHLFVRGLGDRYNSAYVNGLPVPSPDPDKRVIPLNLFPTSVISDMSVRKVGSPELYGDFAGASVDIRTKSFSDKPVLDISVGTSFNSQSTFRKFNSYEGGSTDWLGYDKNVRIMPANIENQKGYRSTSDGAPLPFNSTFDLKQVTAPVNSSIGIVGGNSYTFGAEGGSKFGFLVAGNYDNGFSIQDGQITQYNKQSDTQLGYNFDSHTFSTQSSVLGTAYLRIVPGHELTYSVLGVNMSSDQVRDAYGFHFDYDNQGDVLSRRMSFKQNKLFVQRLGGEHRFLDNESMKVDWSASYSTANSTEPDRRQLVYIVNNADYDNEYALNVVDVIENHRYFQDLAENELAAALNVENQFQYIVNSEGDTVSRGAIQYGFNMKQKSRDLGLRIFAYNVKQMNNLYPAGFNPDEMDAVLSQENHDAGEFQIIERTGPEAQHWADLDVMAGYTNLKYDIIPEVFSVSAGARYEMGDQSIVYRKQDDGATTPSRRAEVISNDLLPSLSGRVKLPSDSTTTSIMKFGFFKSISRPGMRELAPFEYTEVFAGAKTMGNPELQNGTNYNADLRYEFYPETAGELIAVGAFGKLLQDPIERILQASASGQLQTFDNIDQASVAGLEFEITKNVGGMISQDTSGTFLDDVTLSGNFAYMYSNIKIDTTNSDASKPSNILTNTSRPLQGASPYLLNIDLTYQKQLSDKYKTTVGVAYNVFGRRVYAAGILGLGDFYEASVSGLNIVWKSKFMKDGFDKWGLNLKLSNVLNPTIRIEQEVDGQALIVNSYKRGLGVGLSFNYSFF